MIIITNNPVHCTGQKTSFKTKINIIYLYSYFKNIWRDIDYLTNIVG